MKETFETLNQHFLDLYNKKISSLPPRNEILCAVDIAVRDPSHENSKYVNLMYHALKDLFRHHHNWYYEYSEINEESKEVTVSVCRIYPNAVGVEVDPPKVFTPPNFDELYSGKSPQDLNKSIKPVSVLKINALYSSGDLDPVSYLNNQDVEEGIDEDFKPVLNSRILPCDFEDFIGFLGGSLLPIGEEKATETEIPTLESFFCSTEEFAKYINILKETNPPILTSTNALNPDIGVNNRKNAVAAWFSALIDKGKVREPDSDKTRANILNGYFKGLDISSSRIKPRKNEPNYTREEYLREFKLAIK